MSASRTTSKLLGLLVVAHMICVASTERRALTAIDGDKFRGPVEPIDGSTGHNDYKLGNELARCTGNEFIQLVVNC